MCPSDKGSRLYVSGAVKKREKKRRLDNAVAAAQIQRFFVTTTAGEYETSEGNPGNGAWRRSSGGTSTTWTGSSGVTPDAVDNPADCALFQLSTLPSELRSAIIHHGPCRPKLPFAISSENGDRRVFSENDTIHSGAREIERQWLCLSPTMNKPHWLSCWLLGYPSAVQKVWANGVSGNLKTFGMKIKTHEKPKAHIDASITFGRCNALMASKNIQSRQRRPSGGRVCFGS